MLSTTRSVREILIALPGTPADLYLLHQQVWQHAKRAAAPDQRPTFLYRVDDGVVRVRSPHFARGRAQGLSEGPCSLDLAAVIQEAGGGQRAVAPDKLPAWAEAKLRRSGLRPGRVRVERYGVQHGKKIDRATGQHHRITLPVARVSFDLEVGDEALANLAWLEGIGRGRRFGLGMLCKA